MIASDHRLVSAVVRSCYRRRQARASSATVCSQARHVIPDFKRASMSDKHQHAGRKPNRLINEQSPYLRQHAYNPVDWYAWGDEALARAKAENKPILLSIGYSACHWCHVME